MASPKTRAQEAQAQLAEPREASLDDLDSKSRIALESLMNTYVAKKAEIDELEAELESLKLDKIEPIRLRLGLTKIDAEGWFVARRPGRPSLDKDKAKLNLLNRGVALKVITEAFSAATSTGKPYTEIKRKKGA